MNHAARLRAQQRQDSAQYARDLEFVRARFTRMQSEGHHRGTIIDAIARSLNCSILEAERRVKQVFGE